MLSPHTRVMPGFLSPTSSQLGTGGNALFASDFLVAILKHAISVRHLHLLSFHCKVAG